jgi:glycosyltransferase involved in cell wall biosynthesis
MISLRPLARRAWIRLVDRMRYSRTLNESIALFYISVYLVRSGGRLRRGVPRHVAPLFTAARYTKATHVRTLIRSALSPWIHAQLAAASRQVSSGSIPGRRAPDVAVQSVLLLKAPGENGEKGVLFAGNEKPWPHLVDVARQTGLLHEYDLVALSAWSPPKYAKLAEFVGLSPDPIFIGISNLEDLRTYPLLAPAIAPMPLMACDWLNPDDFQPRPAADRDIDVLMVAGWGLYKRHWLLFQALRGLSQTLRVVLIGGTSGNRTLEDIKTEARLFGVRQDLTFLADLPVHQVYEYQARARVSVIFSGREGACVAVTESFFANTPVAMMRDAHVGSKAHINRETGVLLSRNGMSRQLGQLLEATEQYSPRAWALQNISCHRSSARLNDFLRSHTLDAGRPWTKDTVPLFRRYFVPRYLNGEDAAAMRSAIDALRRDSGLHLLTPESPLRP